MSNQKKLHNSIHQHLFDLPNEIQIHIIEFLAINHTRKQSNKLITTRENIKAICNFENLQGRKIESELKNWLNEFWWSLFQNEFGYCGKLSKYYSELVEMKKLLESSGGMKRMVILSRVIKFRFYFSYSNRIIYDRFDETKIIVL